MNLWQVRDIRIHVFECQLADAKKKLTETRKELRYRQVTQIRQALDCLRHWTLGPNPGRPTDLLSRLGSVPDGADRLITANAIVEGCHVLLTQDAGILRASETVLDFGLLITSPTQLMSDLSAAGVGPFVGSIGSSLMMADSHKWTHLMAACG